MKIAIITALLFFLGCTELGLEEDQAHDSGATTGLIGTMDDNGVVSFKADVKEPSGLEKLLRITKHYFNRFLNLLSLLKTPPTYCARIRAENPTVSDFEATFQSEAVENYCTGEDISLDSCHNRKARTYILGLMCYQD